VNSRNPVANITRSPRSSHRWASRATCATGWRHNPNPRSRGSPTSTAPPITANPMRCTHAMMGNIHRELRIATVSPAFWKNSKTGNRDIPCRSFPVCPPLDEPGDEAGYRESVTQPSSKLMITGCGCELQSNQYPLYAIKRPAMIMTAHNTRDKLAATLALRGGRGSRSHSATLRYAVLWNTHAFTPATTSVTIFVRKKRFWYL